MTAKDYFKANPNCTFEQFKESSGSKSKAYWKLLRIKSRKSPSPREEKETKSNQEIFMHLKARIDMLETQVRAQAHVIMYLEGLAGIGAKRAS